RTPKRGGKRPAGIEPDPERDRVVADVVPRQRKLRREDQIRAGARRRIGDPARVLLDAPQLGGELVHRETEGGAGHRDGWKRRVPVRPEFRAAGESTVGERQSMAGGVIREPPAAPTRPTLRAAPPGGR